MDGRYGYDCRSSCNCLDLDEICDKVSGRCQSGCRDGYAGDSCQIGQLTIDVIHIMYKKDSSEWQLLN